MSIVQQSILMPAVRSAAIIPNGVDLGIFRPGDRELARKRLGLSQDAAVLIFTAHRIRENPWKDYATLRETAGRLGWLFQRRPLVLLAVGEDGSPERIGNAEVRFLPFSQEPAFLAACYQAGDLCVHSARADTFPTSVLEGLACGVPVVATATGGIPEQIKSLGGFPGTRPWPDYSREEATGVLVPPADAEAMTGAVAYLLEEEAVRKQLEANAAADAAQRFSVERQVERYIHYYGEVLSGAAISSVAQKDADTRVDETP
jgi:glycosyltransferase involved in cell wall biosynthesis